MTGPKIELPRPTRGQLETLRYLVERSQATCRQLCNGVRYSAVHNRLQALERLDLACQAGYREAPKRGGTPEAVWVPTRKGYEEITASK